MRQNIQRTEERGGQIDNMEERARKLNYDAEQFKRGSNRVMRHLRWKNARMWGWIILGGAILAIIIALGLSNPGFNTILAQLTSL